MLYKLVQPRNRFSLSIGVFATVWTCSDCKVLAPALLSLHRICLSMPETLQSDLASSRNPVPVSRNNSALAFSRQQTRFFVAPVFLIEPWTRAQLCRCKFFADGLASRTQARVSFSVVYLEVHGEGRTRNELRVCDTSVVVLE